MLTIPELDDDDDDDNDDDDDDDHDFRQSGWPAGTVSGAQSVDHH